MQSQKRQNDLYFSQGKPFNITIIQVCAPTSNAEEAELQQKEYPVMDVVMEVKSDTAKNNIL